MKCSIQLGKVAIPALLCGLAIISVTPAQAARDGALSSYDPTFAYTGDPAYAPIYAQSRTMQRRAPAQHQQRGSSGVDPARFHNLPYADRPYGDPDSW